MVARNLTAGVRPDIAGRIPLVKEVAAGLRRAVVAAGYAPAADVGGLRCLHVLQRPKALAEGLGLRRTDLSPAYQCLFN